MEVRSEMVAKKGISGDSNLFFSFMCMCEVDHSDNNNKKLMLFVFYTPNAQHDEKKEEGKKGF